MVLALQSSMLPLKLQLPLAPQGKRQARRACFPSIIASSTKENSSYLQRRFQVVTSKALQLALSSALALGISLSGIFLISWLVQLENIVLFPGGDVIPRKL
jgi:hypothetical protein